MQFWCRVSYLLAHPTQEKRYWLFFYNMNIYKLASKCVGDTVESR